MRAKIDNQRFSGIVPVIFLAVFFITVSSVALCGGNGYAFMIDKSPPAGGIVTPDVGVRQTSPDETILLNASPKIGYRFLYWLGDVEDPTRNHTSVQIDSPKLIIAVFERVGYESPSSSGSGPKTMVSSGGVSRGGGLMGMSPSPPDRPPYDPPDDPPYNPPIPEPATIFLLGGGLAMLNKRIC